MPESSIAVDAARTLPVRSVPAYLVERYHRVFDDEVRRLQVLIDTCPGEIEAAALRSLLETLQLELRRHVLRQEGFHGLFTAVEAGGTPDARDVEDDERAAAELTSFLHRLVVLAPRKGAGPCGRALGDGLRLLSDEIERHLAVERNLFLSLQRTAHGKLVPS